MNPKRLITFSLVLLIGAAVSVCAQDTTKPAANLPIPRTKDGKKLLTAMDLMKFASVSGFHFSPDGKRLVLTAVDQPNKDEEDRKKVKDDTMVIDHDIKMTHLWLFDIDKKEEKRLTEGDYTVSDPQWAPDGTRISYT